jgi:anti-sigma factor ChrR (cupin superfamily)
LILRHLLSGGLDAVTWEPFSDGLDISWLYRTGDDGPAAALLRYAPGARVGFHRHAGYEHALVLQGSQSDGNGRHRAGTLVVNPPGTAHDVVSEEGCIALLIWERPVIFEPEPGMG